MLFCIHHSLAQKQTQYFSGNGLPSDQVYDMYQDVNGLMWFATDRGLVSYDGKQFVTYTNEDGLPTIAIQKFFPQASGEILCSTISNDLFFFDPKTFDIRNYRYADLFRKESLGRDIAYLYLDDEERLYASFQSAYGFLIIDKDGEVELEVYKGREFSELSNFSYVTAIAQVGGNEIMPCNIRKDMKGAENVQNYFDSVEFFEHNYYGYFFRFLNIGSKVFLTKASYLSIIEDGKIKELIEHESVIYGIGKYDEAHFWIGLQNGGFAVCDLNGQVVKRSLEGYSVTDVEIDHEGLVWASTLDNGVYCLSNNEFHTFSTEKSLSIEGIERGPDNSIYVLVGNTKLLKLNDGKLEEPNHLNFNIAEGEVICYAYSEKDGEVFSHSNYVEFLKTGDRSVESFIGVSDEPDDKIYFWVRGFYTLDEDLKRDIHFVESRIYDLCKTPNGVLLGTSEGLSLFDRTTNKITPIETPIISSRITEVANYGDHFLIGTLENGVIFYDLSKNRFIPVDSPLSSNSVHTIEVCDEQSFLVGTNKGVNYLSLNADGSYSCVQLGYEDGLINDYIKDLKLFGDTLYVATARGLTWFHKGLFGPEVKSSDYYLRLKGWRLNREMAQWQRELLYNENSIEFNFTAISFRNNRTLKYRYRLLGLSDEWKETSTGQAIFERLPAGDYVFQVEVGVRGRWTGQTKEWAFRINEAFYATWWFILLMVLVTGTVVYLFFRYRILSYNRDILRELLRYLLKRLKLKSNSFVVREGGKDVKINSENVLYVKSLGNYLEIHTLNGKIVIRETLSGFLDLVPDSIEYLRVHRSYIVRIDRINSRSNQVVLIGDVEVPVGKKYTETVVNLEL